MKALALLIHAELCQIARRWLLYPHSKGGHCCQIGFVEPRVGFLCGEISYAIGFRAVTGADGSVMVECKASRPDFLADRKKPHRQGIGKGRWPDVSAEMGRFVLDCNTSRESLILTKMLQRAGDAEAVNHPNRAAEANVHRVSRTLERYRAAENKLSGEAP